jgi:hypothetical protein
MTGKQHPVRRDRRPNIMNTIEGVRIALVSKASYKVLIEFRDEEIAALERFMSANDLRSVPDSVRAAVMAADSAASQRTAVDRIKARAATHEIRHWLMLRTMTALREMAVELNESLMLPVQQELERMKADHPEVFEESSQEQPE